MPTGQIETRQIARLAEMGAWLQRYGETIYGTRGGPFMPGTWGASTCRGDTVYVHILNWKGIESKLILPPLPARIVKCSMLTGGSASVKRTRKAIQIAVPASARQEPDTIVVLQLDKPAFDLQPVSMEGPGMVKGGRARASNVHQNDPTYGPDKAIDGNESTRWATDGGTHQAWLAIRLPKRVKVGQVTIKEACGNRVQSFVLEYRHDKEWKPCLKGATIGEDFHAKFPPVTAQEFRLNILNATEGPTIWEFQLKAGDTTQKAREKKEKPPKNAR
jgi:alpha-L-fucosidase